MGHTGHEVHLQSRESLGAIRANSHDTGGGCQHQQHAQADDQISAPERSHRGFERSVAVLDGESPASPLCAYA